MRTFQYTAVRDEMLDFLPPGPLRILDVGCGAGTFGAALRSTGQAYETWAVEPDPLACSTARERYDHLVNAGFPDAATQLPEAFFDVVFFNDVLEHLYDPAATLKAVEPVLRPGGIAIASIPNVRHFMVIAPLVVRGEWTYTDEGLLDRTHVRFFTRATAGQLFTDAGWSVHSLTGINRRRRLSGRDSAKLQMLSRFTRGRSDDFFWLQYAVVAAPPSAHTAP